MKFYVTKYVPGEGVIREVECNIMRDGKYAQSVENKYAIYKIGKSAFLDRRDAVTDAKERVLQQLVILARQVKKLQAMKFE